METKKIQALESALRSLSYETLVQVKETIAREAASRETRKVGDPGAREREAGDREGSDTEMMGDQRQEARAHYDPPPGYPTASTTASAAASLAKLNYNISQMTSGPGSSVSPGPVFSSPLSLASSLPPSVPSSSF